MKARYQTSKKENGETSHEVVCECELMHWQLEFPSHGAAMNYIAALDDEMHQQLATEWVDTLFKVYPHEKGLSTKGAIERENVIESLGRIFEIVATRAKALQPNLSELQSGVDAKLRNAIMPVLFDHALGVFLAVWGVDLLSAILPNTLPMAEAGTEIVRPAIGVDAHALLEPLTAVRTQLQMLAAVANPALSASQA